MKKTLALIALAAALTAPLSAQAHRQWLMPAFTTLSGDDGWVSFDGGSSNGVFVPDHNGMRLAGLTITAPDGTAATAENALEARYRSTFDLHLTKAGTYRIANVSSGMMASYTLDGEQKRWRGAPADFPAALPAGATDVRPSMNSGRTETFVTLGAPNTTALAPTGKGLELVPVTHPTDLVVDEPATFKLVSDGQPAANLTVTIARGGVRYRNATDDMTVTTDAEGAFTVTWPEAGMYWIGANVRTEASGDQLASSSAYNGSVEVLP